MTQKQIDATIDAIIESLDPAFAKLRGLNPGDRERVLLAQMLDDLTRAMREEDAASAARVSKLDN